MHKNLNMCGDGAGGGEPQKKKARLSMEPGDTKLWLLRQKLNEAQRYPHLAENALRDLYEGMVSSNGELLDREGKRIVKALASEGVVASIVGVMTGPRATPRLVYRALGVLTLFAQEEAQTVEQEGGFHAIMSAMRQFPDVAYVQEAAIVSLVECGRRTEQYTSHIQDVLGIVVQTMDTHKYSPSIFYLACTAIRIATQSGVAVNDELANRVFGNILDGIILFPLDEKAQNTGREVLGLWVGFENALDMIRLRASALLALEDIVYRATGVTRQHTAD